MSFLLLLLLYCILFFVTKNSNNNNECVESSRNKNKIPNRRQEKSSLLENWLLLFRFSWGGKKETRERESSFSFRIIVVVVISMSWGHYNTQEALKKTIIIYILCRCVALWLILSPSLILVHLFFYVELILIDFSCLVFWVVFIFIFWDDNELLIRPSTSCITLFFSSSSSFNDFLSFVRHVTRRRTKSIERDHN